MSKKRKTQTGYDKKFYDKQMDGSLKSAQIVIPLVLEKLNCVNIHSCVDFGCGVGTWLFAVKNHVKAVDVLGMDFGEPVKEQLKIDPEEYRKKDLSNPIILDKTYDLCISLEVAEHIKQESADIFVENLAKASDIVLFSAALPGQGGTEHVNEQRLTYWVEKFTQRGFELYDVIRPYIWYDEAIEPWYRQNMVLFCKKGKNIIEPEKTGNFPVDIVHPRILKEKTKELERKNDVFILINWGYLARHHNKIYRLLKSIKRFLPFR